jgi:hypothetical protein
MWSQVRALWLVANIMATGTYMVVNFRAREISRNARKLTRTLTLIIKKKGPIGMNASNT